MSNKAEYELSKYTELETLDAKGDVILVKENYNGEIWVKKHITAKSSKIYEKLIDSSCKNIVNVFKLIELDGSFYIIEEYIKGHNLKNLLIENGTLSAKDVRNIICQLCDGLDFLHSKGIIHRDIKPANIMIDNNGIVKLIDMDISRIHKKERTSDTTILGTAGFAAPEQFGFQQTDVSADIYSVGVLMNVLLTGDIPSVRQCNGELSNIIEHCTKIDPSARYSSAAELKRALIKSTSLLSRFDGCLDAIPGFRSGSNIKKVVAVLMYTSVAFTIGDAFMCFAADSLNSGLCFLFYAILGILVPFLIAADYLEYQEKLPIIRNLHKRTRKILGIIFAFLFFSFAATIIPQILIP